MPKRSDITDLQVCQAYIKWKKTSRFVDEILMNETGCPLKVVNSAMIRAEKRGYVECGVSLRAGWLSPKGEEFVRRANA